MTRISRPGLALAACLLLTSLGGPAVAEISPADAAQADQIPAPAASSPRPEQVGRPDANVATSQVAPTGQDLSAPPSISTPAQGRATQVAAIQGHDRCDPAAGAGTVPASCANILDQRGDQFAPPPAQTAKTADTNAPSDALVGAIVGGGTGTVVLAPADGK